jgi:methionyl-tRNA formyltransferase
MRVVFLGTGDFAVPALRALHGTSDIVAVVSQPDRPSGRGLRTRATAVRQAALELGLRHIQTEDVNALDAKENFADAELGVVAAFGQKLSGELLGALPRGFVNIHASLLPKYRGAAPIQWAIINGESHTGVTIFRLNERWDAGPILATRQTAIGETETADELHDRLADLGAELIVQVVRQLHEGAIEPRPQEWGPANWPGPPRAPKLSRADGWVDFSQSAFQVQRRIHGLWPWPTAACVLEMPDREPLRLQLARAERADPSAEPTDAVPAGTLRDDLTVQCGRGCIRLLEVKPSGGKRMPFDAFARGRRLQPGLRLRSPKA